MTANEPQSSWRSRLAQIIEVGASEDLVSRGYDLFITATIVVNLAVAILSTFQELTPAWGGLLRGIEGVTVALFGVDYLLRLLCARYIYPRPNEVQSMLAYAASFAGLVDLFSFLPYYLPIFFPAGTVAFRMFRIIRIFRLFRINSYYDSLNAITQVLVRKKQQLLSSVFILLVLMVASSLCMYSVEHDAQPEVFRNAFSGIWWSVSTLLTVGYGDIYPVTTLGKLLAIVISFLGVGMVAIPTGIISAGFVEQYTRMQKSGQLADETGVDFFKLPLKRSDPWAGKAVKDLDLPCGMLLAALHRGRKVLLPEKDLTLQAGDILLLAADVCPGYRPVELKQVTLSAHHPWAGQLVRDLDLSRRSLIVLVRRDGHAFLPESSTRLREGDLLWIHTRLVSEAGK